MQNPLEHFLADLANKIQTAKEYKEIVKDSQNVDVNKNVFEGFITGVAETIKKELKERATVVPVSAVEVPPEQNQEEDSFVKFVSTLANTISASKNKPVEEKPVEVKKEEPKQTEENEEKQEKIQEQPKQPEPPKEDSFQKFIGNLKDIIQKTPPEKTPKQKKKESKGKVDDYVSELKRDENEEKSETTETAENSIKNLVRKFIESEIKNFKDEMGQKIGQMGSSYGGGGSNSYNYYPGGGPMFGSLQFPNSGTGIIFADGSSLTSAKTLTGGGGGGGGDPAVNALVYSNSANWNAAYTNLIYNSAAYLSGTAVELGDIPSLSSNWNSNYTTTSYYSAFWNAAVDEIFTFYVTQTSAASAFWTEDGNYYFIQNSKLDNWQLWNSMYTTLYLNSAGWESVESNVRTLSSDWNSVYTTVNINSAKYESVYSTYNTNSASYATEILAIAYAVAL